MAMIPNKHKQYDLLPGIRNKDLEAIEYPSIATELSRLLPKSEHLVPYGYANVDVYIQYVENMTEQYAKTARQREAFQDYIENVRRLNQKEFWSVLEYTGEEWDEPLRFTPGRAYYWPCDPQKPEFLGIIDDEEFTAYLYAPDPDDWKILDDPTGMAYETMYGRDRDKWKRMFEPDDDESKGDE